MINYRYFTGPLLGGYFRLKRSTCINMFNNNNNNNNNKTNRPDILVKDKKANNCLMIDMTIPSERNVSIKQMEKLSKYKDLEMEVTKMWKMKTSTIPVAVGVLGLITKGMGKYINQILGSINVDMVQKIVLLGSAHILRTLFIT